MRQRQDGGLHRAALGLSMSGELARITKRKHDEQYHSYDV